MRLLSVDLYPGPNRFGFRPVARCLVDIGVAAEAAAAWPDTRRTLAELTAAIPTAGRSDLPPPPGTGGGLADWLRDAALYLQAACGHGVAFGTTRAVPGIAGPGGARRAEVAFEVALPEAARATAEAACALLRAALPDGACAPALDLPPWPEALAAFTAAATLDSGLTVALEMVAVATRLGIPVRRLYNGRVVQAGWGSHAVSLYNGITAHTSQVAGKIVSDKSGTVALLADHGLPTSEHKVVRSAAQAVQAAAAIGYPVVVKPRRGNKGKGVSANLTTPAQVAAAYATAAVFGAVLVERFLPGTDHRLLVIDGSVAAAVARIPAQVVGDGRHTVAELVALTNRREARDGSLLNPLTLDEAADRVLAAQGVKRTDRLPDGVVAWLRSTANFSTGGTTVDVTDSLHPAVRAMAVQAATALGLDVAGVDYITPDAARPPSDGGGITEVNAGPGLRLHFNPTHGQRRDVVARLLRGRVPATTAGRLPVTVITGRMGKQATARLLGHLLALCGRCPGVYQQGALHLAGQPLTERVGDAHRAARVLLADGRCDAAVLEVSPAELAEPGLPVDRCEIAVLLDAATDPPPTGAVSPTEAAARLAQGRAAVAVAVRGATLGVIINADDPRLLEIIAALPSAPVTLVSLAGPDAPTIAAHRAAGRRIAILEPSPSGDRLSLVEGSRVWLRLPVAQVLPPGMTGKGRERFLRRLLAALAAAHAQGVPSSALAMALRALRGLGDGPLLPLRLRPLATGGMAMLLAPPEPRAVAGLAALLRGEGRLLLAAGDHPDHSLADLPRKAILVAGDGPGRWTLPTGCDPLPALAARTGAEDILALIDPDQDRGWRRLLPLLAPPPRRASQLPPGLPWRGPALEACCLARQVPGTWVSGGPLGWKADGVAWDADDVRPGDLAILPVMDCATPAAWRAAEARVMEAVRRGAVALIAPLVPRDLARALPLFLTDDPAAALEALAVAVRTALTCPVVTVEAAAAALLPDLAAALAAAGPLARPYRPAPPGLGAALTLAGLPLPPGGGPGALLYPLPEATEEAAAALLLLRPTVHIPAGTPLDAALAALAPLLPEGAGVPSVTDDSAPDLPGADATDPTPPAP